MDPNSALQFLVGILNQTTMINRGGRESGLTVNERTAISQASHVIHRALNAKPESANTEAAAPKAKRNRK